MAYRFKTEPRKYQLECLRETWRKHYWAYIFEMGLGKTKVTIDNASVLFERELIAGLLVLAPKGLYDAWVDEIDTHMPNRLHRRVFQWEAGDDPEDFQCIMRPVEGQLNILIVNIEAVRRPTDKAFKLCQRFLLHHSALCALDESSSIKNPDSKQSKQIRKLAGLARFKRILTGTPITESPLDAWAQYEFLNTGCLGYDDFWKFKLHYAQLETKTIRKPNGKLHQYKEVVGYQNINELQERLARCSTVLKKVDCEDLPPKIYERRLVPMRPEVRKVYQELVDDAFTELGDEEVSANFAMVLAIRLQQVTAGYVKTDQGEMHIFNEDRIKAVTDIIDEGQGKFIIWCKFVYDVERMTEVLNERYGEGTAVSYYGATKERDVTVKSFQNNPAIRFFVSNKTGARGITLTAANTVIYYSQEYSLDIRRQSEDRAHRIGQDHCVTYVDLHTPGTVDADIAAALARKAELSDAIIESVKNLGR